MDLRFLQAAEPEANEEQEAARVTALQLRAVRAESGEHPGSKGDYQDLWNQSSSN